jgi:hypothetical protein
MKNMHARIAGAVQSTGSMFKGLFTRAAASLAHLKKSEVAEAMIATWCVEFLRVRRFGGFHVVEIVVISVLMLGVKTIVSEASKRKRNATNRSYPMQSRYTQVEPMDIGRYPNRSRYGSRRAGFNR